jgi:very-short-patch-repair endonuclease
LVNTIRNFDILKKEINRTKKSYGWDLCLDFLGFFWQNHPYIPSLKKREKDINLIMKYKVPAEAEKIFWKKLKKYKYPFLRQKAIYRFILDFYCSKLLLAIEIDGGIHNNRKNYDDGRDDLLNKIGIKTVRFKNEEVLENIEEVFKRLEEIMKEREKEIK